LKREGVCAASLPTTMGVTAGFLVQNALKKLLGFGSVSYYLGYNALQDFFPRDTLRPNVECTNSWCLKRQAQYQEKVKNEPPKQVVKENKQVKHEANEWGISIISTDEEQPITQSSQVPIGTEHAYTIEKKKVAVEDKVAVDESADLSDLMSQLKNLSTK